MNKQELLKLMKGAVTSSAEIEGIRLHELYPEDSTLDFNKNNLTNSDKSVMITILDNTNAPVGRVWGSIAVSEGVRSGKLTEEHLWGLRVSDWTSKKGVVYPQLVMDQSDSVRISMIGKSAVIGGGSNVVTISSLEELAF